MPRLEGLLMFVRRSKVLRACQRTNMLEMTR